MIPCSNIAIVPEPKVSLKEGSCPNKDKMVHLFSLVLICAAVKYFNALNLFLPKNPQDLAENLLFFICLFPLCWNSNSKKKFCHIPISG